jgi:adenine-specific DNA-methyltransferase
MARIDDLVTQIPDKSLRLKLEAALTDMKRRQRFGLVYEEHVPETSTLLHFPVTVGATVQHRTDSDGGRLYQVKAITARGKVTIEPENGGEPETVATKELMVVKRFGDPIFPALTPLGSVERGGKNKPYHAVINGENFHTLQLFVYLYEDQVDCIYIDPPYNTGSRDWKYNNHYVDSKDSWRHSKWLSFMEKRLKLAKRLLKSEGVLIVTIDEHEVHHLGMLLEKLFKDWNVQMVSSQINPAIVARAGSFGRSDEYIFFVTKDGTGPQRLRLTREWVSSKGRTHTGNIRWDLLRRSGPSSARKDSPGCFYPIYVNPEGPSVEEIGDALPKGTSKPQPRKGCVPVLPIRQDGTEGRWQWTPKTIRARLKQGRVRITGSKTSGFVVSILKDGEYAKITREEFKVNGSRADGSLIVDDVETESVLAVPGSQWRIISHDATQYGSRLLTDFLPGRKFPFPKSLYAVEDTLRFFVQHKPDALILDFFGGSGTTAHAVFRLNRQDGGQRRSITVTNNEVSADEAGGLRKAGVHPGDKEWDALGIFEYVTRPRITAAVTGCTPEGTEIDGEYKFSDEFQFAEGFLENVEFFRLDYLDADEVDLGTQFDAIHPSLWLAAGGIGKRVLTPSQSGYFMPDDSPYAILYQEQAFRKLRKALETRPDITNLWIVTDSEDAFAEMRSAMPSRLVVSMLYRDYLRNFRINTRQNL